MAKEPISTNPARSAQMALIKGRDTKPEMRVRRALHSAGLRYRLHDKRLPGKPDLAFFSRKVAIFVHGCFWHRHPDPNCKLARLPKSRLDFWQTKLEGNAKRDAKNKKALESLGWRVIIVWECEIAKPGRLIGLAADIRSTPPALKSVRHVGNCTH